MKPSKKQKTKQPTPSAPTSSDSPQKSKGSKSLKQNPDADSGPSTAPRTLFKTFQTTTTVLVGPTAQPFVIHTGLLTLRSEFFAAALSERHGFKEAIEKVVKLPEERIENFEYFIQWLYTKSLSHEVVNGDIPKLVGGVKGLMRRDYGDGEEDELYPDDEEEGQWREPEEVRFPPCSIRPTSSKVIEPSSRIPEMSSTSASLRSPTTLDNYLEDNPDDTYKDLPTSPFKPLNPPAYYPLVHLYCLALRLCVPALQNAIVSHLAHLAHKTNTMLTPSDTHLLYTLVPADSQSKLKKLIVHLFASMRTERLLSSHRSAWNEFFLRDLVICLKRAEHKYAGHEHAFMDHGEWQNVDPPPLGSRQHARDQKVRIAQFEAGRGREFCVRYHVHYFPLRGREQGDWTPGLCAPPTTKQEQSSVRLRRQPRRRNSGGTEPMDLV
ncbi:MAG: hypothetical protein M1819_002714 [Sarea resinae]|nr:MAG: hypothetical protein M1819_002714 [Sarea resinae]